VVNLSLKLQVGTKSGDDHDKMNHTNFMTWVRTKLLPNLPRQAVLLTDNASYHNVKKKNKDPTTATKKKNEMISWLIRRNITHDSRTTKP
jgi:predicted O-methyltransferase YrrM